MSFSKNKEKMLKQMPIIRSEVRKSKDDKYLIHRTTITTIKPKEYYEVILNDMNEIKAVEGDDSDLRDFLNEIDD